MLLAGTRDLNRGNEILTRGNDLVILRERVNNRGNELADQYILHIVSPIFIGQLTRGNKLRQDLCNGLYRIHICIFIKI